MPILTTDVGRNATAAADKGGFLVNLASFALTEATDIKLSVLDTTLAAPFVYHDLIQSIEVVSDATVRLTLYVPVGYPASGAWNLTEVGIYLQSGELFARGAFKVPSVKSAEFGLKLYVYVTEARLGEVVNVTFSTSFGLDSTVIRSLIDPAKSGSNAVIVQDANPFSDGLSSASLALRFAAGGSKWAFTGHDMVYRGVATTAGPGSFLLDAGATGGFWLNDAEQVLVSVQAGPGVGETRLAKYDKEASVFSIQQKPFSALTKDSILNIWRETKNQLPTRSPNIPEHYCLGVGVNDFSAVRIGTAKATFDLVQGQVSITGAGVAQVNLPASVPQAALGSKSQLLIWQNGKRLNIGDFALSGRSVVFNTPVPVGAELVIYYYDKRTSNGSTLRMLAAEYEAYTDGTVDFQLGTLPDNKAGIMVFVGDLMVDPKHYTYQGSSIRFTDIVPDGNAVSIITTVNYIETEAQSTIVQSDVRLSAGQTAIQVDANSFERNNTLVMVDGLYVSKDKYIVSPRQILFGNSFSADVSVQIFIATGASAAALPETTVSGNNTGPVWQDPAGQLGSPNSLSVEVAQFVSSGQSDFAVPASVVGKEGIIVMVGGQFQDPITYSFDGSKVVLSAPPPLGVDIDVICFIETSGPGSKADCHTFTFTTNAGVTYNIGGFTTAEPTLIFVGGVYQHRSNYTISGASLTFKTPVIPGMLVEAWVFDTIDDPGSTLQIATGAFAINDARTTYTHDIRDVNDDSAVVHNTLAFVNTVYQSKSSYATTSPGAGSETFAFPGGIAKGIGKTLNTLIFLSGKTKTRLITREEFESRTAGENNLPQFGSWAILPSGMIIQQAGGNTITGKGDFVYFPIQFPNQCSHVFCSEGHAVGWGGAEDVPLWATIHGGSQQEQSGYYHYCVGIRNGQLKYSSGVSYSYLAIGF